MTFLANGGTLSELKLRVLYVKVLYILSVQKPFLHPSNSPWPYLLPVLELGGHLPPVLDVIHHAGRQEGPGHQEDHHDQEDDQSPPSEQTVDLQLGVDWIF